MKSDIEKKECHLCNGEGWVCENHGDKAWKEGKGCCGGAGMQCICTVGGYFGKMKELYKNRYKKLGIPERCQYQ